MELEELVAPVAWPVELKAELVAPLAWPVELKAELAAPLVRPDEPLLVGPLARPVELVLVTLTSVCCLLAGCWTLLVVLAILLVSGCRAKFVVAVEGLCFVNWAELVVGLGRLPVDCKGGLLDMFAPELTRL